MLLGALLLRQMEGVFPFQEFSGLEGSKPDPWKDSRGRLTVMAEGLGPGEWPVGPRSACVLLIRLHPVKQGGS